MRMSKSVALPGVLSALAIVLAVLEQYVPIQLFIPLPGIKLGIANVVMLYALLRLGFSSSVMILLIRCAVAGLLFGSPVSFLMSLTGGLFSICIMWLLLRNRRLFSLCGVSVAGAAAHNVGQIVCAIVVMQSPYVAAYLPVLLFSGIVTGLLIAVLSYGALRLIK